MHPMTAHQTRRWIIEGLAHDMRRTFIKFGDGEYLAITGAMGATINGDEYTPHIRSAIHDALTYFAKRDDARIGYWPDHAPHSDLRAIHAMHLRPQWADYTTLLLQHNNLSDMVAFWAAVRNFGPITYVAPERMRSVAQWLGARHVVVPDCNAHPISIDDIDGNICIVGAGFAAKPLLHMLSETHPSMTLMDVGSGFDTLCVGMTRQDQPEPEEARKAFNL